MSSTLTPCETFLQSLLGTWSGIGNCDAQASQRSLFMGDISFRRHNQNPKYRDRKDFVLVRTHSSFPDSELRMNTAGFVKCISEDELEYTIQHSSGSCECVRGKLEHHKEASEDAAFMNARDEIQSEGAKSVSKKLASSSSQQERQQNQQQTSRDDRDESSVHHHRLLSIDDKKGADMWNRVVFSSKYDKHSCTGDETAEKVILETQYIWDVAHWATDGQLQLQHFWATKTTPELHFRYQMNLHSYK